MRIRTQLILAAFVLAVIPLAAIVTYSYHSSRRALESAYRREADRLTRQMDRRLASIRAELDQRLTVVSALPLPNQRSSASDVGSIVSVMGDAASFVDALEFQPIVRDAATQAARAAAATAARDEARREERRVVRNEPPATAAGEARAAATRPPPPPAPSIRIVHAPEITGDPDPNDDDDKAEDDEREEAPEPPEPPEAPDEPVVIDLPAVQMPRFVMTEEQQDLLRDISRLGSKLAEDREDIERELRATQKIFEKKMNADRARYEVQMKSAQQSVQARRDAIARIVAERNARRRRKAPEPAAVPRPVASSANVAPVQQPAPVVSTPPVATAPPAATVRELTASDAAQSKRTEERTKLILGRKFHAPVRKEGEVVGQITARVSPEQVIQRILGNATDDAVEIPFAVDREGTLYTRSTVERSRLDRLGIPARLKAKQSLKGIAGWIVSTSTDPQSGLRIGVARPVGDNLDELRRTAARNFVLGMGLIAFALIGIVPLSNHLTRDVKLVTDGAERIAQGDLMTRLPVKTDNELGQLARAFNRMAEDLSIHQQKLVDQERTRKEQELQQRLMAVEYERKTEELEEARRFQLSMLPKEVPRHRNYDVAVFTRTATEVGGDYYDFHLAGDVLSVTIGDATGHGAKAGTMVTVVKTLFSGYDGKAEPSDFLGDAAEKIKRMELGRMAMALSLARFEPRRLTVASAGMPPALVHRAATSEVEEITLGATPLGTLGVDYAQSSVDLAAGDTVLFLTDGLPELMNDGGQQFGYVETSKAFAAAARAADANGVIEALELTTRQWHGEAPPNDDVTFVVVRIA
jgi:serine phosphatase RsbU (regulator of sigma subunit)